jgi:hypothetical protein
MISTFRRIETRSLPLPVLTPSSANHELNGRIALADRLQSPTVSLILKRPNNVYDLGINEIFGATFRHQPRDRLPDGQ